MKKFALLLALVFGLVGCGGHHHHDGDEHSHGEENHKGHHPLDDHGHVHDPNQDDYSFAYDHGFVYGEETTVRTGEHYMVSFDFPKTENEVIDADLASLRESLIGGFIDLVEDLGPNENPEVRHSLQATYEKRETEETLSFIFVVVMDTGLGLPDINVVSRTYAKQSGAALDIFDVLPEGTKIADVVREVRKKIENDIESGVLDPEMVDGYLDAQEVSFERFGVDEESVLLVFPPQVLAPWRVGIVRVELPLELF